MPHYLFSSREGAAVTPAAPRRPEVEEATRLRLWCRARCRGWVSTAGPSALVSRWRLYYRRWRCKRTNHICAHLTAAPVGKSTWAEFTAIPVSFKSNIWKFVLSPPTRVQFFWLDCFAVVPLWHYMLAKVFGEIKSRTNTIFTIVQIRIS